MLTIELDTSKLRSFTPVLVSSACFLPLVPGEPDHDLLRKNGQFAVAAQLTFAIGSYDHRTEVVNLDEVERTRI